MNVLNAPAVTNEAIGKQVDKKKNCNKQSPNQNYCPNYNGDSDLSQKRELVPESSQIKGRQFFYTEIIIHYFTSIKSTSNKSHSLDSWEPLQLHRKLFVLVLLALFMLS